MKKVLVAAVILSSTSSVLADSKKVELYGSFRPVASVMTQGDDTTVDTADALSRFGFKGDTQLENVGKAYLVGEWAVPIQDSAQLEKSRLALVGVETQYGTVEIGKMRPAHYSMIAEYADIFNHGLSPFAYDSAGSPFFIDNAVKYSNSMAGFKLEAMSRNTGNNGESFLNVGLGYTLNMQDSKFYLAAARLQQEMDGTNLAATDTVEFNSNAFTLMMEMSDLYVALVGQQNDMENNQGGETEVTTMDLSAAYPLGGGYKAKAGYFTYDDDIDGGTSGDFSGFNLTLENQLADNVRVHIEYLHKDFTEQDDPQQTVNLGLRYDFATNL